MLRCNWGNANSSITYRKGFLPTDRNVWVPYRRVSGSTESLRGITLKGKKNRCYDGNTLRKDCFPLMEKLDSIQEGSELCWVPKGDDAWYNDIKVLIQLIILDSSKHVWSLWYTFSCNRYKLTKWSFENLYYFYSKVTSKTFSQNLGQRVKVVNLVTFQSKKTMLYQIISIAFFYFILHRITTTPGYLTPSVTFSSLNCYFSFFHRTFWTHAN